MVKKIRRRVRHSVVTTKSRYGRNRGNRGSTLEARYSGGKRTGIWSFWLFPRLRARSRGSKWALPRFRW